MLADLKLIIVLKISGFQVFLADNFHDRILELFLEGDVFATGIQVIQQLLTSTDMYWFTLQQL